ncbi:MAG TPA: BolA family protein [Rhizomicrobium sp.]|nr:BolA family protein [Rhizomicrobium sp.]
MTIADTIRAKLTAALAPDALTIEDESAKHAGHAGARPEGETHFRVRIVSRDFEGVSRIERQRRVYGVLAEELRGRVHALALTALAPEEASDR